MQRIYLSDQIPEPVLVIGSLAYDHIITPKADSGRIPGGSANFAAVAVTHFAPARIVAVVGNDYEEPLLELLKGRDTDISGIKRDPSGKTFFWRGKYGDNFNLRQSLETDLNVFANFNPVLPTSYQKSKYVMLGAIQPSLQMRVLDQLSEKNAFVLADTIELWVDTARADLMKLFQRVDMICINDSEAKSLSGCDNLFLAGKWLCEKTAPIVLIKKGEHGAVLFHPEGVFILPAYPVTDLRDPTGAGDSFAGALIGALSALNDTSFASIRRAMAYAAATASLTVEDFSFFRLAAPQAGATIEQRAKQLRAMTSF